MLEQQPGLKSLRARKEALVGQAAIQRTQLARDIAALRLGVSDFTQRVRSWRTAASIAASGAGIFSSFQNAREKPRENGRRSPISTLLSGVRLATSLWQMFRSRE